MMRLRGHHLICLHFFSGEGYDRPFIENLESVLKQAESRDITVCAGTDDICEKCPYKRGSRCEYYENADDEIKGMDNMALSLLGAEKGEMVRWEGIKGKIPEIFCRWYNDQCAGCEWRQACEKNQFYQRLISRLQTGKAVEEIPHVTSEKDRSSVSNRFRQMRR